MPEKCADCGHPRSQHPNDNDCANGGAFDDCGCVKFVPDLNVTVPLSVLFRIQAGIIEATNCRKAKAAGCDCRVGGLDALAMVQRFLGRGLEQTDGVDGPA